VMVQLEGELLEELLARAVAKHTAEQENFAVRSE